MPEIVLPLLHQGQIDIYNARGRFNAVRCGRRFGKTRLLVTIASNFAAKGKKVGVFAPEHRQVTEPYDEVLTIIDPIKKRSSKMLGEIRTTTGGLVDFWHLNDNLLAGRGREYDVVLIDEAAFAKDAQMPQLWERAIKPTLLTRSGSAWVFSTPNGISEDNFFYLICNDAEYGFTQHHAPTQINPYVPPAELDLERERTHPLVYRQEYDAEFVDFSGVAFFSAESLTDGGQGVPFPQRCDEVFAVIDTALKDGAEHDGTAVIYFARNTFYGTPLIVLDWDVLQIEGALLEQWLPTVNQRLEDLAKKTNARRGSVGMWIEDKASGIVLLQQAQRRGLPAQPIEGDLTSMGKEGRALSISGYVYRGDVKFSDYAYDKTTNFKGQTRNQLLAQVCGFRIGMKTKHVYDLLDCFTYGVAIALGNSDGY